MSIRDNAWRVVAPGTSSDDSTRWLSRHIPTAEGTDIHAVVKVDRGADTAEHATSAPPQSYAEAAAPRRSPATTTLFCDCAQQGGRVANACVRARGCRRTRDWRSKRVHNEHARKRAAGRQSCWRCVAACARASTYAFHSLERTPSLLLPNPPDGKARPRGSGPRHGGRARLGVHLQRARSPPAEPLPLQRHQPHRRVRQVRGRLPPPGQHRRAGGLRAVRHARAHEPGGDGQQVP